MLHGWTGLPQGWRAVHGGCCYCHILPEPPRLKDRPVLNLLRLAGLQITESHATAGAASQLVYARIDAPRFAKIYTAKGRWGLLDSMLLTTAAADAGSARAAGVISAAAPGAGVTGPSGGSGKQSPALELQQVEQAVKRAAADILGEELGGEERRFAHSAPSAHAASASAACRRGVAE